MNVFKLFTLVSDLMGEVTKAMSDNYVTLYEVCIIADKVLQESIGKGLKDIGFKISKKNSKTKVEFVI